MKYKTIHITGASGSGTTTLAKAIQDKYGYTHYDTDDFFWENTDPPFLAKRKVEERQKLLSEAINSTSRWVISGSLTDWGDIFIPTFEVVIYVYAPTEIRIKRLHERELQEFGDRILPGGDMFEQHLAFLEWASKYDNDTLDMRSAAYHNEWLKQMTCPIIKVDGTMPVEDNIRKINL